jgi:hypothetical protein
MKMNNGSKTDQVLDILGDILPAEPDTAGPVFGRFEEGDPSEQEGDHGSSYGNAMCLGPELTNQTDLGGGYGEDGEGEFVSGKLVYYAEGRGRQFLGYMEKIHVVRRDGTFTLTGAIKAE